MRLRVLKIGFLFPGWDPLWTVVVMLPYNASSMIQTQDLMVCLYLNLRHGKLDHSATTAGWFVQLLNLKFWFQYRKNVISPQSLGNAARGLGNAYRTEPLVTLLSCLLTLESGCCRDHCPAPFTFFAGKTGIFTLPPDRGCNNCSVPYLMGINQELISSSPSRTLTDQGSRSR